MDSRKGKSYVEWDDEEHPGEEAPTLIEFLSPVPDLSKAPSSSAFNQTIPSTVDAFPPNPAALLPSEASKDKEDSIAPPFPWSTDRRAVVHTMDYLLAHDFHSISGDIECTKCSFRDTVVYDLEKKLAEVGGYIAKNRHKMRDRAPQIWVKPPLPGCRGCPHAGWLRPVIAPKKREINWLFLFLDQRLGVCSMEQLKYFCKHNGAHRTGRKEQLLLSAYIGICKQLDPTFQ